MNELNASLPQNFEQKAGEILGKERVLGASSYQVIENEYNKRPNSGQTIKFLFPEANPDPSNIGKLEKKETLVFIPDKIEFSKQVETTEGMKTEVDTRPITLKELGGLFPDFYDRNSNVKGYEDEPIVGGWKVEHQSKYMRDDSANKIKDLPSPSHFFLAFLRDYLSERTDSPFLKAPETNERVNTVFCRTASDKLSIAIGASQVSRSHHDSSILFVPFSKTRRIVLGKAIGITALT